MIQSDSGVILNSNSAECSFKMLYFDIAAAADTESKIMLVCPVFSLLEHVICAQVKHSHSSLKCLLFKMNSEIQI